MTTLFLNAYEGRRVLVTGHTGFKGSWLSVWLHALGAKVAGYSAYLPSNPCNFSVCQLENIVEHRVGDVRNYKELEKAFCDFEPEMVFHLAAQPIVRKSYEEPRLTFETNMMGTVNVLELIRKTSSVKSAVLITSDKCYENVEWDKGYIETDRLGGRDPYSASKASAEIAISSYVRSFFSDSNQCRIASARAGNVIGGGDWADDRIVPDCIRAVSTDQVLEIRSPVATRPWQHVLEPISGYLWLGANLLNGKEGIHAEAFNFGPSENEDRSVSELMNTLKIIWGNENFQIIEKDSSNVKECTLLKLNCKKVYERLGWKSTLHFQDTVTMTVDWYKKYYDGFKNMRNHSVSQIQQYTEAANKLDYVWAKG